MPYANSGSGGRGKDYRKSQIDICGDCGLNAHTECDCEPTSRQDTPPMDMDEIFDDEDVMESNLW